MTEILDGLHKVQYSLGSRMNETGSFYVMLLDILQDKLEEIEYTRIYLVYVCFIKLRLRCYNCNFGSVITVERSNRYLI